MTDREPRSGPPPGWIVNAPSPGDRKTFCVLGVARGGTSMVSGLLAQLGVPMGESFDPANIEDLEFTAHRGYRRLFWGEELADRRTEYIEHLTRLIRRRNERHPCWGWKDPISIYYVADLDEHLINPHYVLVTRDAGAIASAEMLSFNESRPRVLLDHMRRANDEYARCLEFLSECERPTLVLSYERALRNPVETVDQCMRFVLGDEASLAKEEIERLVTYIRPDRRTAEIGANIGAAVAPAGALFPLLRDFATYREWMDAVAGLAPVNGSKNGPDDLYGAAATALNQGDYRSAGAMACRCLAGLAGRHPLVALGPAAVAEAVNDGPSAAHELPELLVGLYNVVGLAVLQNGEPGVAQDHFEAGHVLARRRLQSLDPAMLPISSDLLWWLAFHAALAAKAADRPAAWRRNIEAIRGHIDAAEGEGGRPVNLQSARIMYERAQHEGLA